MLLMAVKGLIGGGEHLRGKGLPRKDRGVLVLQIGVFIAHAAEADGDGRLAHPPFIAGEAVGPVAGHCKALVDVVFFIRGRVGRQNEAVQQPKAQHQRKHKAVQRNFSGEHRPDGKRRQHRRQSADNQEESCQVAADALVGNLHGHCTVNDTVANRHLFPPERHTVTVANGQNGIGGVMRRDLQPVATALLPGHSGIHTQRCVLVGHNVVHHALRPGQLLAGVGIPQHHIQRAAGLLARQVKFKAYRQNILIVGKFLRGGLTVIDKLCPQEIGDDFAAALARIGADLGQPNQHHRHKQHDQREQRGQQWLTLFLLHEHSLRQALQLNLKRLLYRGAPAAVTAQDFLHRIRQMDKFGFMAYSCTSLTGGK